MKRIFALLILTMFVLTNTMAIAMQEYKPELRELPKETSMPLRGEVRITNKYSPVTLSLRDSDVSQVLRMFADKAGLNIILHPGVGGARVTLDLVQVPLNKAFEMVLEITNLTYVMDGNTLIVAPTWLKNFNIAKQDMTSIPVKYVDAAVIAEFLNKNIYGIEKAGISGGEVAVTNPSTNELLIFGGKNEVSMARKVVEKFDKQPTNTIFKVNHTTPAQMAQMVCTQLLPNALGTRPQAQNAAGGMQQGAQAGTQAGMQTGVQAGVQAGGTAAMSALILNQGTIACTYDTKVNSGNLVSLGGQTLSVSYYTAQGTVNVLGGSPQQVEMIKDFIVKTDKKQPQAYLEVSIIELNESGSKTLANIWEVNSKFFNASFNNDGNTKVNELLKNRNRYPEYPHVFSTNPHVSYSINYLVENKKARVVANPRILITNGQKSVIDMTSDYVKTVTSQVIQGMTGAPAVQRTYEIGEDQGIKVNITPFISPDGYVTLDIAPEYSVQAGQIYATNADGAETKDLMATLLSRRNLDLKSVRIKDGETLVIGGMINEKESKTIQKVPVLGDLPLIGSLFRSTGSEKTKEEMIIMLTPKIINDTDGRETL